MKGLIIEEWVLYPTHLSKRIVRIRMDKVAKEINPDWLAAVKLDETGKDTEIVHTSKI